MDVCQFICEYYNIIPIAITNYLVAYHLTFEPTSVPLHKEY